MDDLKYIPVTEFIAGIDQSLPASGKAELVLEWLPTARSLKDVDTIKEWIRKNLSKNVLRNAGIYLDPADMDTAGFDRFFVFSFGEEVAVCHPVGKEGYYYGNLRVSAEGGVVHAYNNVQVSAKDTQVEAFHEARVSLNGGCEASLSDKVHAVSEGSNQVRMTDFAFCRSESSGNQMSVFDLHDSAWLLVDSGEASVRAHDHNIIQMSEGAKLDLTDLGGAILLTQDPQCDIQSERSVVIRHPEGLINALHNWHDLTGQLKLAQLEWPMDVIDLEATKMLFVDRVHRIDSDDKEWVSAIQQADSKGSLLDVLLPHMDALIRGGLDEPSLLMCFDKELLRERGIFTVDTKVDLSVAPQDYYVFNAGTVVQENEDSHRGHFAGLSLAILKGGDHQIGGGSIGLAFGDTELRCFANGKAYLAEEARCQATDRSLVLATGSSLVEAERRTRVYALDRAHVDSREQSICYMRGESSGEFKDESKVIWRSQGEGTLHAGAFAYLVSGECSRLSREGGSWSRHIAANDVKHEWEKWEKKLFQSNGLHR